MMVQTTLKPKRISDQVFEKIRDRIYLGELLPGEQLKSERELCDIFSVSRPTIRQAIKKLVDLGLVEHRQGQGTYVRDQRKTGGNILSALVEPSQANLRDLLEVRMGLECQAATAAAQRASGEDVELLFRHNQEMARAVAQGGMGTEEDVRFHMSLAYATKNPLQIQLMKSFYDYLHFGIEESLIKLKQTSEHLQLILSQHQSIASAVKAHDGEGAGGAMRQHITTVIEMCCGEAYSLKQTPASPEPGPDE